MKSLILFFSLMPLAFASTTPSLESALQSGHWNEAAQTALETLDRSGQDSELRMKTAYALFQRGFPNAALLILSKMRPSDWKAVPQGQDRFAEVVALMQKTIPLNLMPSRLEQVVIEDAAPALQDEIRFARGREAFEKNNFGIAIGFLNQIPVRSRFYAQARYILATISVKSENYKAATAELTKLFEPTVLEQSTEFWREMSAQMTSHWGTNLKIMFDSSSLAESKKTAELAVLAMARIAYATKDFGVLYGSMQKYQPTPPFFRELHLKKFGRCLL